MAIAMLASCSDNDNPAPEPEAPGEKWAFTGWDLRYSDEDLWRFKLIPRYLQCRQHGKRNERVDKGGTDTLFKLFHLLLKAK